MAAVTVPLEAYPGRTLTLAAFHNVTNAAEIKQRVIAESPAFAVVSAHMILDKLQVLLVNWLLGRCLRAFWLDGRMG